jgi:hypothetical protein
MHAFIAQPASPMWTIEHHHVSKLPALLTPSIYSTVVTNWANGMPHRRIAFHLADLLIAAPQR